MAWTKSARDKISNSREIVDRRTESMKATKLAKKLIEQDKQVRIYGNKYPISPYVFNRFDEESKYLFSKLNDDGKLLKKIQNKLGSNSHGLGCKLSTKDLLLLLNNASIKSSDWSRGKYDLARYNDEGPYEINNRRFITHKDNMKEINYSKIKNYDKI